MLKHGVESVVDALGRKWTVGRMTYEVMEKFSNWVRPQLRDPLQGLESVIDRVSPQRADELLKRAEKERAEMEVLDWDSPAVRRFRETSRGAATLFWFMLQEHQPSCTGHDALLIAEELGPRLQEIMKLAIGDMPARPNPQVPAA